jgi:putative redox protein
LEALLKFKGGMKIEGSTKNGLTTQFDSFPVVGGERSAPTPMEVMLHALGGCTMLDVISILRKKKRQIDDLTILITAEKSENHPKVFTKAHLLYELTSPDAELKDLERSVELSEATYCSVSAMFKRSGCELSFECSLVRSQAVGN